MRDAEGSHLNTVMLNLKLVLKMALECLCHGPLKVLHLFTHRNQRKEMFEGQN